MVGSKQCLLFIAVNICEMYLLTNVQMHYILVAEYITTTTNNVSIYSKNCIYINK